MRADSEGTAVVVASMRSPALLAECLDALERSSAYSGAVEAVFVSRPGTGADVAHLFLDRPWAKLVPTGSEDTIPRLRGAGMKAAGGGWIAVTEDHCLVDETWVSAFNASRDPMVHVTGGGMGNARGGPLNWAAFFSEYGFFSSERAEGEGFSLVTGANVLYSPAVSVAVAEWAAEGLWEDVIHQRLADAGSHFRFNPRARVRQNATYSLVAFCRDRFEHGRDYARVRVREHPDMSRFVRIATTPLLPFVLTARVGSAAARENFAAFLLALPVTFVFLSAWSLGEAAGYLSGGRP